MAVGNKYQLHILSRSQYDSLPKSSDYLYFVSESDGRINLYKGDVLVSNSFFIVPSLPSSGTLGKLYLNTGDGLVYYHSGSAWVKLSREVITSGLSGASTNDTVPSSKLVWDTINSFISDVQEAQASAESARDAAISAKADAETAMGNAEAARDSAISAKADAESARGEAQTASAEAEAARDSAISAKADAESAKADAETAMGNAESARDAAISAKADAESARGDAQTASAEAEAARDEAVSAKVDAEVARGEAESARSDAWAAKVEAETARDAAVSAKAGVQEAQASAESARDAAVSAKADAETARAEAESARGEAQTASAEAESARDDAVSAKVDAEIARGEAQMLKNQTEAIYESVKATNEVKLIPSSASEITLSDGTHAHVPDVSPTYTLPAVSDNTVTHTVFLSVSMTNTASFSFQDASGNTIAPSLSGGEPAVGDFWQFMCEYSILQDKWMVLGYKED